MNLMIRRATMLAILVAGLPILSMAQVDAKDSSQGEVAAHTDATPAADKGSVPPASSPNAKQELSPTVEQKIDALQKQIDELKSELLQAHATPSADSNDAVKLKTAEKELTAGTTAGAPSFSSSTTGQEAAPATAAAAPVHEIPAQVTTKGEPFPGDWTWLNNNGHQVDSPMATKYFTPEFRADANYTVDYNHPEDDTLGGSTETFRSDEWQLEQISLGGDIRIDNVRGRFLCLCGGLWAVTTTRNDGSVVRGTWDLSGAYKYVAEGWGGYHWDVQHGLNVDAGIFVSYIGLFSYYNFDNWTYQPSFVSSNTPWFFNGARLQWFPTAKLKIEPWFVNGWQTYARPNGKPGLGGQVLWRPTSWLDVVTNNYGLGEDDALEQQGILTTGNGATRSRLHTDNSVEVKYYDQPKKFMDKMAFTLTGDLGCEYGGGPAGGSYPTNGKSPETGTNDTYSGGVNCHNASNGKPKQAFAGWMAYQRFWFKKDLYAITLGGGQMTNPGRYLTLLPPINNATAVTGTPYFTENPGDRAQMHDGTITLDYMPSQFITFRLESGYRFSDVPYWTGHGGITPPGGANGSPADYQCAAGGDAGVGYFPNPTGVAAGFTTGQAQAISNCVGLGLNNGYGGTKALWWPDLRTNQTVTTIAIMVRF